MTNVDWDFGDGNTATDDLAVDHTYAGPGTYTATATVNGGVGQADVTIASEVAAEPMPFDPGEATVQEVIDYVGAHPDEVQATYDAEQAGKHRVTLLSYLVGAGAVE